MIGKALFTSDKSCWETPQTLFDELDREFHFDLDAAASDDNHKCDTYFTKKQDWGGAHGVLQSTIRK